MGRIWHWCRTALVADDLYIRVAAAWLGTCMLAGCVYLLWVAAGTDLATANPWIIAVGAILFLAFLAMGIVLSVAAFQPPGSRWWRWAERIDPTHGASSFGELMVVIVALLVVLPILILPTLLLRACGVNGYSRVADDHAGR